jgi:hypothetical protein
MRVLVVVLLLSVSAFAQNPPNGVARSTPNTPATNPALSKEFRRSAAGIPEAIDRLEMSHRSSKIQKADIETSLSKAKIEVDTPADKAVYQALRKAYYDVDTMLFDMFEGDSKSAIALLPDIDNCIHDSRDAIENGVLKGTEKCSAFKLPEK